MVAGTSARYSEAAAPVEQGPVVDRRREVDLGDDPAGSSGQAPAAGSSSTALMSVIETASADSSELDAPEEVTARACGER